MKDCFSVLLASFAETRIATNQVETLKIVIHLYIDNMDETLDFHIGNFLGVYLH